MRRKRMERSMSLPVMKQHPSSSASSMAVLAREVDVAATKANIASCAPRKVPEGENDQRHSLL